jgi:hypothetical protein
MADRARRDRQAKDKFAALRLARQGVGTGAFRGRMRFSYWFRNNLDYLFVAKAKAKVTPPSSYILCAKK